MRHFSRQGRQIPKICKAIDITHLQILLEEAKSINQMLMKSLDEKQQ